MFYKEIIVLLHLNRLNNNLIMNQSEVIKSISQLMRSEIPEAETILYGSRARGSMRLDSDFDILILLPDTISPAIFAKRKTEIFGKLYDLELDWNVVISPLILLKSMWKKMKTPFTCNVERDGIRI